MTSNNHPDHADRFYRDYKALMERAAEMEMEEMFKRERLVPEIQTGNRAERRKQAALSRRSQP